MPTPTTAPRLRAPLKWHGGKTYLAGRIVGLLPPHDADREPFAGGAAVLLRKPPAAREVLGDLDPALMPSYRALRDRPAEFAARVRALPYSPETFARAEASPVGDTGGLARAAAFLVRDRMSRGGLGEDFAWSERLRGGRPGDLNAWETFQAAPPAIAGRLRRVELAEGDALAAIARHDRPGTLLDGDPPYVPATRTACTAYRFELSTAGHGRLLAMLDSLRHAAVLLSGYRCELYDSALAGWRHDPRAPILRPLESEVFRGRGEGHLPGVADRSTWGPSRARANYSLGPAVEWSRARGPASTRQERSMSGNPAAALGGRPSKLTTETALRIVAAVARGQDRDRAARAAGVGASTLYRWLQLGRAGREPHSSFVAAVAAAGGRGAWRSDFALLKRLI